MLRTIDQAIFNQEGEVEQTVFVSEGEMSSPAHLPVTGFPKSHTPPAPHLVLESPKDNNHNSVHSWPCQNVGNYKQGPAMIQKCLISGEQYDFSFMVISYWELHLTVSANHAIIQTNDHPTQGIHKSFLAKCYLLQDSWINNPECLRHISSNVILDSWESDNVYIMEILDPHLLAAHSSACKYNEENPSWDTATKGPFQEEFC